MYVESIKPLSGSVAVSAIVKDWFTSDAKPPCNTNTGAEGLVVSSMLMKLGRVPGGTESIVYVAGFSSH